jgi:hypothetical protein
MILTAPFWSFLTFYYLFYDLWFTFYDLWFTFYGLWFTFYDLWFTFYDLWFTFYSLWFTLYDLFYQCSKLAVVRWPAASEFVVWPVKISKPQVWLACRGIFFHKKFNDHVNSWIIAFKSNKCFSYNQVDGIFPVLKITLPQNRK